MCPAGENQSLDVTPELSQYIDHVHHQQQPIAMAMGHRQPFDLDLDLDLQQRDPISTSPPPYGDATMNYQHQIQRLEEAGPDKDEFHHDDVIDDVTTSAMYLSNVVSELMETERTYVAELQQIVKVRPVLIQVTILLLIIAQVSDD